MRPFHQSRPHRNQPHHARPGGGPGPPPQSASPMQHQLNHPAFPNLAAAANPMAAAAAANPFLALQLLGQAQQLQNLGFLAAALQQQQQPFFPGGFPPNTNQFAPYPGPHAGFNGGGQFRPGGPGVCGPRPPRPMMNPPGNGCDNTGGGGAPRPMMSPAGKGFDNTVGGGGAPMPMMSPTGKGCNNTGDLGGATRPMPYDRRMGRNNSSGGNNGEVNHSENKADRISDFASENFGRNKITDQKSRFNSGRDGRDGRQFGASRGRGRGRNFNQGRGRGSNSWRENKPNFTSHGTPASGHCGDNPDPVSGGPRKRPTIVYDANEVKQWVEARKKNFPSCVNINKKLSQSQPDGQTMDEAAQIRRQELKEVLAKQQELGFELPELPPGYLSGTEDRGNERKNNWKNQRRGSRFENRGNSKRPRYERGDSRSKRPKAWDHTPRDDNATAKSKEQTLLQKLLSSDIKRDRHRLLHTFKFMVLNNFFKDWPDKPLEYPSVTVNQIELESDLAVEDLDDLQDAEMIKDDSIPVLKENDDMKELIDADAGSADHNVEEDEDDASAESEDDGNEAMAVYEEQCNESEDDFSA